MSKGSNARPFSVDRKTFEDNWDKIFKKNVEEKATEQKENKQDTENDK
jgi:hypothetical protein